MKTVMVSNFMNHHQLPFSQGILSQDGVEYTFVALEAIPQERLDMGYEDKLSGLLFYTHLNAL